MTYKFILLYGLPGAGKTTLCDAISEQRKDVMYANLAAHPKFNQLPLELVLAAQIRAFDAKPVHILVEGCFPKIKLRERLIRDYSKCRIGSCVFLDETCETLSTRRNRTKAAYSYLKTNTQVDPNDIVIKSSSLEDRIKELGKLFPVG
jgi:GTPase SAR1 family protein